MLGEDLGGRSNNPNLVCPCSWATCLANTSPRQPETFLLVGYHGEPKVNLFHNTRIISGKYYPKKVKGYLLYF